MRRTFKTQVLDKSGTLNRLTSTFLRRQFNIVTLSVTPSTQPGISDLTFVAELDEVNHVQSLIRHLEKQVNVLTVQDVTDTSTYSVELLLVKVATPSNNEVLYDLIQNSDALVSVLKEEDGFTYLQAAGNEASLNQLLEQLSSLEIEQVSRTGTAALL
ncbi:acetolactate synthase small subunit [Staphylococcus debuckii]|uniref:Acetolactate synthase small subunit n=1 Tax=Staphylococcus debuckii TaxID=2044912 RepID=A0ABU9F3I3_9STAP|nr:acetolactate synthase small subunit [Staphylococcus debuckii]AYU55687.1 acetolactate synthase small subunit [Staphylococcus debuckii]